MYLLIDFHDFALVLVVGILVFVSITMGGSLVSKSLDTGLNSGHTLEAVWTLAPASVLLQLAFPSLSLLYLSEDFHLSYPNSFKVEGQQWWWGYSEPYTMNKDISSLGANPVFPHEWNFVHSEASSKWGGGWESSSTTKGIPLSSGSVFESCSYFSHPSFVSGVRLLGGSQLSSVVFPPKEAVQVEVTSKDVLHAWALPAVGVKIDAVPGRINQACVISDEEHTIYGQCSELCGDFHSAMPIKVEFSEGVIPESDVMLTQTKTRPLIAFPLNQVVPPRPVPFMGDPNSVQSTLLSLSSMEKILTIVPYNALEDRHGWNLSMYSEFLESYILKLMGISHLDTHKSSFLSNASSYLSEEVSTILESGTPELSPYNFVWVVSNYTRNCLLPSYSNKDLALFYYTYTLQRWMLSDTLSADDIVSLMLQDGLPPDLLDMYQNPRFLNMMDFYNWAEFVEKSSLGEVLNPWASWVCRWIETMHTNSIPKVGPGQGFGRHFCLISRSDIWSLAIDSLQESGNLILLIPPKVMEEKYSWELDGYLSFLSNYVGHQLGGDTQCSGRVSEKLFLSMAQAYFMEEQAIIEGKMSSLKWDSHIWVISPATRSQLLPNWTESDFLNFIPMYACFLSIGGAHGDTDITALIELFPHSFDSKFFEMFSDYAKACEYEMRNMGALLAFSAALPISDT